MPTYTTDFPATCLLTQEEDDCWYGECKHEKCGFQWKYMSDNVGNETSTWMRWKEVNGKVIKVKQNGTAKELWLHLFNRSFL